MMKNVHCADSEIGVKLPNSELDSQQDNMITDESVSINVCPTMDKSCTDVRRGLKMQIKSLN
jgi:hypothetical protein